MPTPIIFSPNARHAKRRRAQKGFAAHDFIHRAAIEDVVDRLEAILKPFPQAVFYGAGAGSLRDALTEACGIGQANVADEIPSPGTDQLCDPSTLPFQDQSQDLVVSLMSLHAVNDLPGTLAEIRRILRPDGLFIGVFPGERSLHELRTSLQRAEDRVLGRVSARVAPMVAVKDGGALLQRAGFAMPVADLIRLPISYGQPMRLFQDLRGTGETSCLAGGPKGAMRRDVLAAALATYQEMFPSPEGGIQATVELIALTGWAPHRDQPKPLKPGSATASLAAAVKNQGKSEG